MARVSRVCAAFVFAFCGAVAAQVPETTTPGARIAWLREHAVPLRSVDPGNGFADLEFLKSALDGVRIVGLGESTHGTHEFYRVRHRLIEFLVTQMGFSAVAIELRGVRAAERVRAVGPRRPADAAHASGLHSVGHRGVHGVP
jgi:erythromycin esterase-like protein